MTFEDLRRRELIIKAVKGAVRESLGVDAEEVTLIRGVMAKDWLVLEYEVKTKFATIRPRLIFTKGDPAKALEEAERILQNRRP